MAEPRRQRIRLDGPVYSMEGQVFSVTIGTSPRAPVFAEQSFGLECIRILSDLQQQAGNPVYAFCLMPDHVHLLLESDSSLSATRLRRTLEVALLSGSSPARQPGRLLAEEFF